MGLAVPIEAEPAHAVEDRFDRRLGRSRLVRILDAQQELPAMAPRIEPVEQGSPRPANMEEAGGRGREARDDGLWACAHALNLQPCGPWRPSKRAALA